MNAVISIDRTVDLPASRGSKYPYAELEIGESFMVPNGVMQIVCNANWKQGLKLGKKFTCRKCEGGIRVWRTK